MVGPAITLVAGAAASSIAAQHGLRVLEAALATVYSHDQSVEQNVDQILQAADVTGALDLYGARDAGLLDASSGARLLAELIDSWDGGNRTRLAKEAANLLKVLVDGDDQDARILVAAAECVSALAEVMQGDVVSAESIRRAAHAFVAITRALENGSRPREARDCAMAALGMWGPEDPEALDVAERAFRLAQEVGDEDFVLITRVNQAVVLAAAAEKNDALRLAAFDAGDAILRHLVGAPAIREVVLPSLIAHLRAHAFLDALKPVMILAIKSGSTRVDPRSRRIAAFASPIWQADYDEATEALEEIVSQWIDVENARFALEPQPREQAEAVWATWSVEHPAFKRALPSGDSILHEENLATLLLTVGHEVTHVLSMFSGVGRCVLALRAALLEVEIQLWRFAPPAKYDRSAIEPAPLEPYHPTVLARAEQGLELAHKLRLLQEVWDPWLEGLAVYGELAADPTMGREFVPSTLHVVANLRDVYVPAEAEKRGLTLMEAGRRVYDEEEQRYANALRLQSRDRLRAYLEGYGGKYLAGYLAVRAVVSAWRRTYSPSQLTGVDAFRVLLHVMRFGSEDAVPDLGLDLETFRREAPRRMTEWVRRLGGIQAKELDWLVSADSTQERARWVDGRLIVSNLEDEDAREEAWLELHGRVEEALTTLTSARANPARIDGAVGDCRAVMNQAAQELPLAPEDRVVTKRSLLTILQGRNGMMPIGRAACPFWLNRQENSLWVLIRNVERHREHGRPSYQLAVIQLDEKEAALLEEESRRLGAARLDVVRIADLATPGEADVRGFGHHYMAYTLGAFTYVETRGLLWGYSASEVAVGAVYYRLINNPILKMEVEKTADGKAGALRTRDWLDQASTWSDAKRVFPLEPWAAYVRALAEMLIDGGRSQDSAPAARALLDVVLPAPWAAAVEDAGLRPLRDYEPSWMTLLIDVLDRSARAPAQSDWLDEKYVTVAHLLGPLFTCTGGKWDVAALECERAE